MRLLIHRKRSEEDRLEVPRKEDRSTKGQSPEDRAEAAEKSRGVVLDEGEEHRNDDPDADRTRPEEGRGVARHETLRPGDRARRPWKATCTKAKSTKLRRGARS